MNYTRIVIAAVVATIVDALYGFLVWGMVLNGEFARYPAVYRPGGDLSALPLMLTGVLVAMFFASYIYAKGYEGGAGFPEGARFGALLGLFIVGMSLGNYAVFNIGSQLALSMALAGLVEWTLVGVVIGLVYRAAPSGARRVAGV
jgi:hypothetical protein